MKAFSIIWGIFAIIGLVAILIGATHHWITCLGSTAMCIAAWPRKKEDDYDKR